LDFRKVHLGIEGRGNGIFIGLVKIKQNGMNEWIQKSTDRTDECIQVLGRKLKIDMDKREDERPYVGYEIPRIGKLVLIKSGYNFECYKETEKRSTERKKK
jgi:hypothetical protein